MAPASSASASAAEPEVGLVFIPGAKVDPWAYASILSGLVTDDDLTVVITKPWLNLAFFDLRPLSSFTDGFSYERLTWIPSTTTRPRTVAG